MEIMFVGSVVGEEQLKCFPHASVAGNKMQMGLLKGLHKQDLSIEVLSVIPRRMFRSIKGSDKLVNRKERVTLNGGINCKNIFYINFVLLKQITIAFSIFFSLFGWAWRGNRNQKVLIVYNTLSYMAVPVRMISKFFHIKSVGIIADVPIPGKKGILRRWEEAMEVCTIPKLDALVPLTKYTAGDFAPERPYLVIEGGQEVIGQENICYDGFDQSYVNVVFSGTLNGVSGIELALEAFARLDGYILLHIYGDGEKREKVMDAAREHQNIFYHGRVSNAEMMAIQKSADLLICPRRCDDFVTKYTFPSKVLEYMVSGVPVLCNGLLGIPEEYNNYINVVSEETADVWGAEIVNITVTHKAHYKEKALRAKAFVLENKNWDKQCQRLYTFLKKDVLV